MDPSAVLSTKLGSTLLRKPIATVSLHRQRTSRRQRANLHRLVNGDVYGSRILFATPTSLPHVRATRLQSASFPYLRARARVVSRMNGTDIRIFINAGLDASGLQCKLLITSLSE